MRKPRVSAATSAELFWSRVNKRGPIPKHAPHLGRCWEWTGARDIEGYGRLSITTDGKRVDIRAHRRALELMKGRAVNGLCALHKCDNRICMRHLYAGSRTQNALDRVARGRGRGRYSKNTLVNHEAKNGGGIR